MLVNDWLGLIGGLGTSGSRLGLPMILCHVTRVRYNFSPARSQRGTEKEGIGRVRERGR